MQHVLGRLVLDRGRCAEGVEVLVLPHATDRAADRDGANMTTRDRLLDLADRARRLPPPDRRDPEAFHIARADLAAELRALAAETDPARRSPLLDKLNEPGVGRLALHRARNIAWRRPTSAAE